MNTLDRNSCIRQIIRKNRYQNVSIFLLSFVLSIAATSITYSPEAGVVEVLHYYSYTAVIAIIAVEILLLGELTTLLHKKFSILNNNVCSTAMVSQSFAATAAKLMKIMDTHHHLSDTSRKLNEIFGFPVLVTTAVNFQIGTTSMYYALQLASFPQTITGAIQLTFSLLWSVIMLVEVFVISKSFENIAEMVCHLNCMTKFMCLFVVSQHLKTYT